jgi:hypothetical protein
MNPSLSWELDPNHHVFDKESVKGILETSKIAPDFLEYVRGEFLQGRIKFRNKKAKKLFITKIMGSSYEA